MRCGRGFTLVEVLVVLVILALTVTFTSLGFQRLERDPLVQTAAQLSAWLQLVSDDAVLDGAVYGVWLQAGERQLARSRLLANQWQRLDASELPRLRLDADFELLVDARRVHPSRPDSGRWQPDVLLLPTGMVIPEQLQLRHNGARARIERNADGVFTWSAL